MELQIYVFGERFHVPVLTTCDETSIPTESLFMLEDSLVANRKEYVESKTWGVL